MKNSQWKIIIISLSSLIMLAIDALAMYDIVSGLDNLWWQYTAIAVSFVVFSYFNYRSKKSRDARKKAQDVPLNPLS